MIYKETEVKINLILDYVCKRCEKLNVDTVPSTSPWGHSTVHPFMTIERVNHFENIPKVRKSWLIIWYSGYPNRRDCIWMKIVCCLFAARKGGPKNKYKNSEEAKKFFFIVWNIHLNILLKCHFIFVTWRCEGRKEQLVLYLLSRLVCNLKLSLFQCLSVVFIFIQCTVFRILRIKGIFTNLMSRFVIINLYNLVSTRNMYFNFRIFVNNKFKFVGGKHWTLRFYTE